RTGTPVKTTINLAVQQAARSALSGTGFSAAVVAIDASTGRILAVAEHQAGGMPRVDPLDGQYQPGQAFTIVPTAGLLSSNRIGADSKIPCWQPSVVGGQHYVNIPPVPRLGRPRFSVDFAHACRTAFAELSKLLNPAQLSTAAGQFGVGVQWRLPLSPSP